MEECRKWNLDNREVENVSRGGEICDRPEVQGLRFKTINCSCTYQLG